VREENGDICSGYDHMVDRMEQRELEFQSTVGTQTSKRI
jgi:hypothetical protein